MVEREPPVALVDALGLARRSSAVCTHSLGSDLDRCHVGHRRWCAWHRLRDAFWCGLEGVLAVCRGRLRHLDFHLDDPE